MNRRIKNVMLGTGAVLIMLSATSCAKGKAALNANVKDLQAKVTEFQEYANILKDSITELQNGVSKSESIVDSGFNDAITVAVNTTIVERTEDEIAVLDASSKELGASGDTAINDLAGVAVVRAKDDFVQSEKLDGLERQIQELEWQARDAIRRDNVGKVKAEVTSLVTQEDSIMADFKAEAEKSLKAIDDNKTQIITKYISMAEKQEIVDGKVEGAILAEIAKQLSNDKSDVTSKVASQFALLSDYMEDQKESIKMTVDEKLSSHLQDMNNTKDSIEADIVKYAELARKITDGIKDVDSQKDKEAKQKLIDDLDLQYRENITDFAELRTAAKSLKITSGEEYVKGVFANVVKDAVEDSINDSITVAVKDVTNEYRTLLESNVDRNDISKEVVDDLAVAITGQVGNVETALKERVPGVVTELKNLRGYRDNIAKRVPIIKDFDDTEMVSLEAGEVMDGYMTSHDIAPFKLGKYEVTYNLWFDVYQWGLINGYTFEGKGNQGSDFDGDGVTPTNRGKYQPVTNVSASDAVIWCNAYSEKTGKTPVYTIEGEPVRSYDFSSYDVIVNSDASGYRLPTETELLYAGAFIATEKHSLDGSSDFGWTWYNSDCGTHNVGTKKAVKTVYKKVDAETGKVISKKSAGVVFYDLLGNASELATQDVTSADASAVNGSWDRETNDGKYPYTFYHSFMNTVYTPNSQGLRVAQF